jgi:nucleotide-binding universal stress UspA family protein
MKVLIAYDGSDCAKAAIDDLRRAGLPAKTEAVILTVADVWPHLLDQERTPDDPISNPAFQRLTRRSRAEANQSMADAREIAQHGAERVRSMFAGWAVTGEAAAGLPAWAAIKRAEDLRADLIVVGSQGRSAVGRAVMGSVSQKILHHANCSVRVGRRPEGADEKSDRPVKIVLGVDGSVGAAIAVSAVANRTWPAGSEVRVVTAADLRVLLFMLAAGEAAPAPQPYLITPAEDEHSYARRMLNSVTEELRSAGLWANPLIREGDPKRVLVHEANEWGADCIFVGAQGLGRMERFVIGSVSASVASRAHCSVEIVRASD